MKIVYIAHNRIPTEKAHGIQIMNTCAALAAQGVEVKLVIPYRKNTTTVDAFTYYKIPQTFKIVTLPSPDLIHFGKIGYTIQRALFLFFLSLYILLKKADVFYARDELMAFVAAVLGKNAFWETHEGAYNKVVAKLLPRLKGLVGITQGLIDFYREKGIEADKCLVAHDAVSLKDITSTLTQSDARGRLGLPKDVKLVTYTGSLYLYKWKGVDVFLDAAMKFSDTTHFVLVGGREGDIKQIQEKYDTRNLILAGHQPHEKVAEYLRASDVLVIPNKSGDIVSERYTSPMKLFEYMASGVPIVASKLPSISEILNDQNAFFTEPNSPEELAQKITHALQDQNAAKQKAVQAQRDVLHYTWDERAKSIKSFIAHVLA